MDHSRLPAEQAALRDDTHQLQNLQDARTRATLDLQHAHAATASAREDFSTRIATRSATEQASQNPEVRNALTPSTPSKPPNGSKSWPFELSKPAKPTSIRTRPPTNANSPSSGTPAKRAITAPSSACNCASPASPLSHPAPPPPRRLARSPTAQRPALALCLALCLGFIFFALFTFFVELVPYLPSYRGYLRYLVGLALIVWAGNYAIAALRRYLDAQKAAEQRPERKPRKELGFEAAQIRLARKICPACGRPRPFRHTNISA